MLQEVAKLMMEIQELEKEECLWNEALAKIDSMEKNFKPTERIDSWYWITQNPSEHKNKRGSAIQ